MESNSVEFVFLSSSTGSTPKRKKGTTLRSKFFPFKADPFKKGLCVHEGKEEVTKVISLV